tara:strand:+ start:543 stop:1268 length:726 start_codon:yes stop_codon:yes gene_type:complete
MSQLKQYIENYKRNTDIDLRRTQKFLQTAEKNYENVRKNNLKSEMVLVQKNIARLTEKCEHLKDILGKIERREMDDEIEEQMILEQHEREEKERVHLVKLERKRKNKAFDANLLKKHRASERKMNHTKKWEEKDLIREYNRFERNSESLPNYMKKNLSEMPNNKGYIWKNIRFYGEKDPLKDQPDILFEKMRGGVMYIHEITEDEHKIFEKKGKERKRFFKLIPRKKQKADGFNLFDFVKK